MSPCQVSSSFGTPNCISFAQRTPILSCRNTWPSPLHRRSYRPLTMPFTELPRRIIRGYPAGPFPQNLAAPLSPFPPLLGLVSQHLCVTFADASAATGVYTSWHDSSAVTLRGLAPQVTTGLQSDDYSWTIDSILLCHTWRGIIGPRFGCHTEIIG